MMTGSAECAGGAEPERDARHARHGLFCWAITMALMVLALGAAGGIGYGIGREVLVSNNSEFADNALISMCVGVGIEMVIATFGGYVTLFACVACWREDRESRGYIVRVNWLIGLTFGLTGLAGVSYGVGNGLLLTYRHDAAENGGLCFAVGLAFCIAVGAVMTAVWSAFICWHDSSSAAASDQLDEPVQTDSKINSNGGLHPSAKNPASSAHAPAQQPHNEMDVPLPSPSSRLIPVVPPGGISC